MLTLKTNETDFADSTVIIDWAGGFMSARISRNYEDGTATLEIMHNRYMMEDHVVDTWEKVDHVFPSPGAAVDYIMKFEIGWKK